MDETAALRNLDDRLRGVPKPDGSRMAERERRSRMAYFEGAEEWSREYTGRGLTEGELEGVVRRSGDARRPKDRSRDAERLRSGRAR
jgi:hypothetical protein